MTLGLPDGVLGQAVDAVRSADRDALAGLQRLYPQLVEAQVTRAPGSKRSPGVLSSTRS
jgi:hypothetical protein